ncbi:hypothetical protein CVS40_11650 [Lucilia cuprina]|nr:hypothetical protein CVS40_11650 [Lucilia cuprina]
MRHTNLTAEQTIERIFRNSQSDYQWYIRRQDFTTLEDLIQLAADLESIRNQSATKEFLIMNDATENIVLGIDFLQTITTTVSCVGLQVSSIPNSTIVHADEELRQQVG